MVHIVTADWVVSCRMVQVLVEEADTVILAAAAVVAVADSTAAAAAAAAVVEGNSHHHSCTLAEVVCRTGMEVDVTLMLRGEIHSLVVL